MIVYEAIGYHCGVGGEVGAGPTYTSNLTRASPRVQPDRVCCLNIVSIRIIGNDLTRCWSVTVNHKMGGSNPLLPAKQMLTDQLLGQLERCKRLAEDMWFDSIR